MKSDNKNTQTFISRMPTQMHKDLRFISMYTGMTMQEIGNYAISKEIELFKTQIPTFRELSDKMSETKIGEIKKTVRKHLQGEDLKELEMNE